MIRRLPEQSKILNYLTENGLLNSEILDQDLAEITSMKQKQCEDYKVLRVQGMELSKLAKNRDSMLRQNKQTELGNKKPII